MKPEIDRQFELAAMQVKWFEGYFRRQLRKSLDVPLAKLGLEPRR